MGIIFRGAWVRSVSKEAENVWQRCVMHVVMELSKCFFYIKFSSNFYQTVDIERKIFERAGSMDYCEKTLFITLIWPLFV
jgi:hypothetical protein